MTFRWPAALCCAGLLAAQSGLAPPRIGCLRDGDAVRHVLGIAGTFVLSAREGAGVRSVACWGNLVVVKTDEAVELRDTATGAVSRWAAPPGPAVFSLPPGPRPPAAYFPAASEWFGPGIDGEPLSIAGAGSDSMTAVVRRGPRVLWVFPGGERELDESAGLALAAPGGRLISIAGLSIAVRDSRGNERRIELPEPAIAIEWLGEDWVRIVLAGSAGHLALGIAGDGPRLYRLPEVIP